jgi:hypothetical protein
MTNTVYDFRPANLEYLVLSRFDFLLKKQKIYNYMKTTMQERNMELKLE